jgi:hypothetical protein
MACLISCFNEEDARLAENYNERYGAMSKGGALRLFLEIMRKIVQEKYVPRFHGNSKLKHNPSYCDNVGFNRVWENQFSIKIQFLPEILQYVN